MSKKVIATEKAPKAIGPYSQGIMVNGFLYTSGQVPLDPQTGKLVEGDIQVQAKRSLDNLKAIIEAAGYTMEDIVKTTVFLKDIANFKAVNEVYAGYFSANPPARSAIQVAALPLNAELEIEAVAFKL
ncbi:MAG: RidA family protein [Candidatus Delongbacteria bacterium]|nr:RidA family protein [Candidatus Delongbacteria bacterium]